MLQGGIYTLPSHLSPGARDLIPRMLLVDPLKRITIPEIRCADALGCSLPCVRAASAPGVPEIDPLTQCQTGAGKL